MTPTLVLGLAPTLLGAALECWNAAFVLVPLVAGRRGRVPSLVFAFPLLMYGISTAMLLNLADRRGLHVPQAAWWWVAGLAGWHVSSAAGVVALQRARGRKAK